MGYPGLNQLPESRYPYATNNNPLPQPRKYEYPRLNALLRESGAPPAMFPARFPPKTAAEAKSPNYIYLNPREYADYYAEKARMSNRDLYYLVKDLPSKINNIVNYAPPPLNPMGLAWKAFDLATNDLQNKIVWGPAGEFFANFVRKPPEHWQNQHDNYINSYGKAANQLEIDKSRSPTRMIPERYKHDYPYQIPVNRVPPIPYQEYESDDPSRWMDFVPNRNKSLSLPA